MITKANAKEYLPLIQALAEGRTIQVNAGTKDNPKWDDPLCPLIFNLPIWDYRIKPEPRTFYVLEYPDGTFSRVFKENEKHKLDMYNSMYSFLPPTKILTLKEIL